MKSEDKQTCFLLLEDGTVLPGESFGARNHIDGEVGKQHVVLIGYVFGMDNTWVVATNYTYIIGADDWWCLIT